MNFFVHVHCINLETLHSYQRLLPPPPILESSTMIPNNPQNSKSEIILIKFYLLNSLLISIWGLKDTKNSSIKYNESFRRYQNKKGYLIISPSLFLACILTICYHLKLPGNVLISSSGQDFHPFFLYFFPN